MFRQSTTALAAAGLAFAATVTNASSDMASSAVDLRKVFETAKQMATAPRLYSSANQENPGKCLNQAGLKMASEYSKRMINAIMIVMYLLGLYRDVEV